MYFDGEIKVEQYLDDTNWAYLSLAWDQNFNVSKWAVDPCKIQDTLNKSTCWSLTRTKQKDTYEKFRIP